MLDKLEYGNFYKFITSIGVVIMALPMVLYIIIYTNSPFIISNEELQLLPNEIITTIKLRSILVNFVLKNYLIILIIVEIIGILFIYFGCYKWLKKVQKPENEISEANRIKIESEAKIKKAEADEIVKLKDFNALNGMKENKSKTFSARVKKNISNFENQYKKLQDACYQFLLREYRDYDIQTSRIINDIYFCDFIGYSKVNDLDILFEITASNTSMQMKKTKLLRAREYYMLKTGRKCKIMLIRPHSNINKQKNDKKFVFDINGGHDCWFEISEMNINEG